jgi:hypothetical protein
MDRALTSEMGGVAIASIEEVQAAYSAISDVDRCRIGRAAEVFCRKLSGLGQGISPDDLISDAIMRTLDGRRRWKRHKVGFVKHLCEAMRSIASHVTSEERVADGIEKEAAAMNLAPDAERIASAKEQLANIRKVFEHDEEVLFVMDCLADGLPGPEIQEYLDFSKEKYEAVMLRLRRGIPNRKEGWRS